MERTSDTGDSTDPRLPEGLPAEPIDQEEADERLDDYDKTIADSFPASDPPAGP